VPGVEPCRESKTGVGAEDGGLAGAEILGGGDEGAGPAFRRLAEKALIADPGEVRGLRLGQTLDAGQAERGVTGDAAADRRGDLRQGEEGGPGPPGSRKLL
jgi:hypothetical protein